MGEDVLAGLGVVRRETLAVDGKSGATLERAWLADGSALVVKHERQDWLAQSSRDDGRILRLWESGLFDRLPAGVDSAIIEIGAEPDGWVVVMRDVTNILIPAEGTVPRSVTRQLLNGLAELHRTFAGIALPDGLCPLVDRYAALGPARLGTLTSDHLVPRLALMGWERFGEVVPDDVATAVLAIADDPRRLAEAMAPLPTTLVHGDTKLANLGLDGDRLVLIDWGALTGPGPGAADHAFYLALNSARIEGSFDEFLDDVRAAEADAYDGGEMELALLGGLAQIGWEKALGATSDDDAVRARERAGLEWWTAHARRALERWSLT